MNWETAAAIGMFACAALGLAGGWFARVMKGENAAEAARVALAAVETVRADLAAFKTEVARDYASNRMIEQMEERLVKAIERLGDRMDAWIDRPSPRTAPRTRATKERL